MKKYTLSLGQSLTHKPEHPERTASRWMECDVQYQVWPSRQALAKSVRMQQKRSSGQHRLDWRPCVALSDGEGF